MKKKTKPWFDYMDEFLKKSTFSIWKKKCFFLWKSNSEELKKQEHQQQQQIFG